MSRRRARQKPRHHRLRHSLRKETHAHDHSLFRRCIRKSKEKTLETYPWLERSPKSILEQAFIEEYLRNKGYQFDDLRDLPPDESHQLMKEACQYASIDPTSRQ